MRGKRFTRNWEALRNRITPAYAGKTIGEHCEARKTRDHPRVCGENHAHAHKKPYIRGSPPRMRGKLNGVRRYARFVRITPAYAGKTRVQILRGGQHQDHPRVCGENIRRRKRQTRRVGSPPRMRGKLCQELHGIFDRGITPAYAGKTPRRGCKVRRRRDHPRVCGENRLRRQAGLRPKGSPPRMRGKPLKFLRACTMTRITPAYAGKTLKRSFRNQPFCS